MFLKGRSKSGWNVSGVGPLELGVIAAGGWGGGMVAAPCLIRILVMPRKPPPDLSAACKAVLHHEGTEAPGSSPLLYEQRAGTYYCAGCGHPLFTSAMKYDSGSGWPSFFACLPGAFETQIDHRLMTPRVEYHCAECGGHHGHVFEDGPAPSYLRYCNNGVTLLFEPDANDA